NDDASRAVRLYCQAIGDAANAGRGGAVADSGEDVGAMDQPPAEAPEVTAEAPAEEAPAPEAAAEEAPAESA
ncbi:MAG: 30S ribosomal protein S2, partial [Pseudomonadota bacterium]